MNIKDLEIQVPDMQLSKSKETRLDIWNSIIKKHPALSKLRIDGCIRCRAFVTRDDLIKIKEELRI